MGKPHTLTAALAEEIKLCPSGLTAADRPYVHHIRTVKWKDSLDAFVIHNPADRERLIDTTTLTGNYYTREHLHTFLIAFAYLAAYINRVPYIKMGNLSLKALAFNGI